MNIKPDYIGKKAIFVNNGITTFTTAELAAIDNSIGVLPADWKPYAYTATLLDTKDGRNYMSAAPNQALASGSRVTFGIFLNPANERTKTNDGIMAKVVGNVKLYYACGGFTDIASNTIRGGFLVGRKATDNTVVSSKASANNSLVSFTLLPQKIAYTNQAWDSGNEIVSGMLEMSVNEEVFLEKNNDGFVWCAAFYLDNISPSAATIEFHSSIAFVLHADTISAYGA